MNIEGFAFIITLAGVVNGLGIVRWVAGLGEFLAHRGSNEFRVYWIYNVQAVFQFLLHILLWWSLWGVREAGSVDFLTYLYVLAGPIMLYLGTSVMLPSMDDDTVDFRQVYERSRRAYYTVLALLWLWAIFLWPVLIGAFAPTVPMLTVYLVLAVALRLTASNKAHAALVPFQVVILGVFVFVFALELGGVGRAVANGG